MRSPGSDHEGGKGKGEGDCACMLMLLPICLASFYVAGDLAWGHALRHLMDLTRPGLEPGGGLPPPTTRAVHCTGAWTACMVTGDWCPLIFWPDDLAAGAIEAWFWRRVL